MKAFWKVTQSGKPDDANRIFNRHPLWFMHLYQRIEGIIRHKRAFNELNQAIIENEDDIDFNKESDYTKLVRAKELRQYGLVLNKEQRDACEKAMSALSNREIREESDACAKVNSVLSDQETRKESERRENREIKQDRAIRKMVLSGYLHKDGRFGINKLREVAIFAAIALYIILATTWTIVIVTAIWPLDSTLSLRISAILVGTLPVVIPGVIFLKVAIDPILAYLRLSAGLKQGHPDSD